MQLNISQQMKMSQQMKLAPRMIQSMEILQLPIIDLQERLHHLFVAKRVVVMYGGRVVEEASASSLYRTPTHPYTCGLLASVPRLDLSREVSLQPINGAPPDPFETIGGCRFHPRCPAATGQCATENPPLISNGDYAVACWNAAQSPAFLEMTAS